MVEEVITKVDEDVTVEKEPTMAERIAASKGQAVNGKAVQQVRQAPCCGNCVFLKEDLTCEQGEELPFTSTVDAFKFTCSKQSEVARVTIAIAIPGTNSKFVLCSDANQVLRFDDEATARIFLTEKNVTLPAGAPIQLVKELNV